MKKTLAICVTLATAVMTSGCLPVLHPCTMIKLARGEMDTALKILDDAAAHPDRAFLACFYLTGLTQDFQTLLSKEETANDAIGNACSPSDPAGGKFCNTAYKLSSVARAEAIGNRFMNSTEDTCRLVGETADADPARLTQYNYEISRRFQAHASNLRESFMKALNEADREACTRVSKDEQEAIALSLKAVENSRESKGTFLGDSSVDASAVQAPSAPAR